MSESLRIPIAAKIVLTIVIASGAVLLVTNVYFAGKAMPFLFFHPDAGQRNSGSPPCGAVLVGFGLHRGGGVILGLISVWHFRYHANWKSCVSFLGLGSLVILGLRAVRSEGEKQKLLALAFAPSFLHVHGGRWICSGTDADLASKDARSVLILF